MAETVIYHEWKLICTTGLEATEPKNMVLAYGKGGLCHPMVEMERGEQKVKGHRINPLMWAKLSGFNLLPHCCTGDTVSPSQ